MAKLIVSGAAVVSELASRIACRREPGPASAVFVTVSAAGAGLLTSMWMVFVVLCPAAFVTRTVAVNCPEAPGPGVQENWPVLASMLAPAGAASRLYARVAILPALAAPTMD